MIRLSFFFIVQLILTQALLAQVELEFIQPGVTQNDETLDLAFAGGINSAQYQTIDLDGDEDLDLVLFDRSSDKINCFENSENKYTYQPTFEFLFPENIRHWMVLVDYNCDGRKDLFTYTGQGIRVFRNNQIGNTIEWIEEANPLKTFGSSSLINLLFNPTDIPSITDLDGDGDLDILVFDFASSEQIEFHQNHSVENTGSCGLDFVRETRSYGDITDCDCDNFTVNQPCGSFGRVLHAGGKALLSLDYNSDGLVDIVLSQENCENLNYSKNIGSEAIPAFDPFDNTFPLFTSAIDFSSFPAASHEDVTFDGKKDLILSSNERSNPLQAIDFKSSSLLFQNVGATENQFDDPTPFLQDQMIDVGEFAYPAIVDVNEDGFNDLVIGNAGSLVDGTYVSTLSYYQSTGDGLVWQTDDLFGMSSINHTEIKPQFFDINGDQKMDLVFSAVDASLSSRIYYVHQNESLASLDISQVESIDFTLSRLDDFVLDDIDGDDLPDLLLGLSSGRLDYYSNIGTFENPRFELETEGFLDVLGDGDRSNLSLAVGDLDGDSNKDLITTDRSGKMSIYANYKTGNAIAQESLVKTDGSDLLVPTRLGRISKPSTGQFLGREAIAVGSIQGGIRLLATSGTSDNSRLTLTAYPIPSQGSVINFQSNLSETHLEIYALSGNKVAELSLAAYVRTSVNLSYLKEGLYLAKATSGRQSCTVKIIVSSSY